MRERKPISARRPPAASSRKLSARPDHDYSQELMELAVEAANSRVLPEFLRKFAGRAAEMLEAEWAAVGEILGARLEIYSPELKSPIAPEEREWLIERLAQKRPGLEILPLPRGGQHVALYPIDASNGELMGTLCLIRKKAVFSP